MAGSKKSDGPIKTFKVSSDDQYDIEGSSFWQIKLSGGVIFRDIYKKIDKNTKFVLNTLAKEFSVKNRSTLKKEELVDKLKSIIKFESKKKSPKKSKKKEIEIELESDDDSSKEEPKTPKKKSKKKSPKKSKKKVEIEFEEEDEKPKKKKKKLVEIVFEDEEKRPCGIRKSKKNPTAYSKDELVDLAVEKGMKKTAASKMTISQLCEKYLGEKPKDKSPKKIKSPEKEDFDSSKCSIYSLAQLKKFAKLYDIIPKKSKKDICDQLVKGELKTLWDNCMGMSREEIQGYAESKGLSTKGTKKELCNRIFKEEREKIGDEEEEEDDYVLFLKEYFEEENKTKRNKILKKYEDKLPLVFVSKFKKLSSDEKMEFVEEYLKPENIEKSPAAFIKEFLSKGKDEEKVDEDYDEDEPSCIRDSKLKLKDHQKKVVKHMLTNRGLITVHGVGRGKCHGKDTPILMYDGSIKMVQDVKVGDQLMGDDSTPRNVLSLATGRENLYKIVQKNGGENYVVNESHILCLKNTVSKDIYYNKNRGIDYIVARWFNRDTLKYNSKYFKYNEENKLDVLKDAQKYLDKLDIDTKVDVPLKDYMDLPTKNRKELKGYRVGVEFPSKNIELDPYFLGLWLGDGSSNESAITSIDKEIVDYLHTEFDDFDFRVTKDITYHMSSKENKGAIGCNRIRNFLKENNLMNNKHIPENYKINSRENRLKLLAGLIDTDGYYSTDGGYEIIQKSEQLANDIVFLCRSLGFRCQSTPTMKYIKDRDFVGFYNRITFSGKHIGEIPVKLERKKAQTNPNKDQLCNEIKVESLGEGDYYGFTLDGNHRYLLGDFTVTHNTLTAVTTIQCVLKLKPNIKIVIITPTSLQENMKKEFIAYGANPDDDRIRFATVDKFSRDYEKRLYDCNNTFLIVDEAHNLKTYGGKKSKAVIHCAKKAFKVLLLTATPVLNRPNEIVNLIAMVDGEDPINPAAFDKFILQDDEQFDRYFKCKISYYKSDVSEHYPSSEEHEVNFDMTKDYYKKYRNIEKTEGGNLSAALFGIGTNLQAFFNGIRRAANNLESENGPKINWIVDKIIAENKRNKRNKTLVYSSFLDAGSYLVMKRLDALKIPYVKVDGSMSKLKRKAAVEDYNKGKTNIIFISKAGGEGLDLKGTRHVIITEPTWNDANLEQVKGRAIRFKSHDALPSDEQHVDVWNLFLVKPPIDEREEGEDEMDSIDIVITKIAGEKKEVIDEFLKRLEPLSIENNDCSFVEKFGYDETPQEMEAPGDYSMMEEIEVY